MSGAGGASAPRTRRRARTRLLLVERLLGARIACAQHVQADARDHRREPAAQVLNRAHVAALHADPRFLHRVLGFRGRSQHAVGDAAQARAVRFESLGEAIAFAHVTFPMAASSRG
jgi:hypothetical protein